MQHRYRAFGENAGDDGGFPERTVSSFGERQKNSLEEGGRLEQRLLQSHEQVEVETLVIFNVVSNARVKYVKVEPGEW